MDGYTLHKKLRKARRQFQLSAQAQALFLELSAICNEEEWQEQFRCSNGELCIALLISEKSLTIYRQELIDAGLLFYLSGQSKKSVGIYSFEKEIPDYRKFYNQSDSQSSNPSDNQSINQSDSQGGSNASDLYKTETKTETETKPSKSHSGKKNDKKDVSEKTAYWDKAVVTWFEFYESKTFFKPTFDGQSAKALKKIWTGLENISKQKNEDWDEGSCCRSLNSFLTTAYQDKWLNENFLLTNLASKFDAIIKNNRNGHSRLNGLQPGKILAEIPSGVRASF
jgi:hypothetical protein